THQIRVHLSAIQHPIVCDPLYGRNKPPLFGLNRLGLHALSLTFIHPTTGKQVSFEAPLPADFVEAERQMSQ
ncbi:MAG TPA: RluA family pseudouridine synthase, partial [Candidatus Paceibacterota bacterium]